MKEIEKKLDRLVRKLVIKRDNGKCQYCKVAQGEEVHHIFTRHNKSLKYVLDNLILLCNFHHRFAHKERKIFLDWFEKKYTGRFVKISDLKKQIRKLDLVDIYKQLKG